MLTSIQKEEVYKYTDANHVVHTVQCFFQLFNKGIKSIQSTKDHR